MGSAPSTLLTPKRGAHFLVAVGYSALAPSASSSGSGSSTAAKTTMGSPKKKSAQSPPRRRSLKRITHCLQPHPHLLYQLPTQPAPALKPRKSQIQKASSPSEVRSAALCACSVFDSAANPEVTSPWYSPIQGQSAASASPPFDIQPAPNLRIWKQGASSSSAVLTARCRPSGSFRVHGERRGYSAFASSSSPPAALASPSVGSAVSTAVTTAELLSPLDHSHPTWTPTWTRNSQPRFYRPKQTRWNRWTERNSCLGRAQD
jgi:hypothetical protein